MQQVWPEHHAARLLIAGSRTTYAATLKALIDQLPLEWRSRVSHIHNFTEDLKPDLFAACDIFTSPSAYESFGLTLHLA